MGIVFGIALEKSKVFEPRALIRQMQLTNFLMLKVFLTAILTSAIVIFIMVGYDFGTLHIKAYNLTSNSIGGLIFGMGIVIAGACPGTVLVQIGAGYRDALYVLLGGLVGSFLYGFFQEPMQALYDSKAHKLWLPEVLEIPYWQLLVVLVILSMIILAVLEKRVGWRKECDEISEN